MWDQPKHKEYLVIGSNCVHISTGIVRHPSYCFESGFKEEEEVQGPVKTKCQAKIYY